MCLGLGVFRGNGRDSCQLWQDTRDNNCIASFDNEGVSYFRGTSDRARDVQSVIIVPRQLLRGSTSCAGDETFEEKLLASPRVEASFNFPSILENGDKIILLSAFDSYLTKIENNDRTKYLIKKYLLDCHE